jgi:predicted nucleic acid-binding Zn ribbon protein
MKRCDYCGKEISYFDQYCNEECHAKANKFYEKRERFTNVFSILCAVSVMAVALGLFIFSFLHDFGTIMVVGSCTVLAVLLYLLPFPTDDMISKHKIQKAVKITRIVSYIVFGIGIAFLIFSFIF